MGWAVLDVVVNKCQACVEANDVPQGFLVSAIDSSYWQRGHCFGGFVPIERMSTYVSHMPMLVDTQRSPRPCQL